MSKQIHVLHISYDELITKKIHLWTLDEIERHFKIAFCEECKTPNCCGFCLLTHLMSDLKQIENISGDIK